MSQLDLLYDLLYDGLPHRTDEIMKVVYGSEHLGLARIGARVYDLKKRMNVTIRSWPDPEHKSLTWYKLIKINFNGKPITQDSQKENPPLQTEETAGRSSVQAGQLQMC